MEGEYGREENKMSRIRTIKPEYFMSEEIGSLTVTSRLLYISLWCHVDRDGYAKFQRTALAAQCLPFEMDQFDNCIHELQESDHIILYDVCGKKYLYIPTFTEHQRPHNTERPSKIPRINADLTVKEPLKERESPTGKGKGKGRSVKTSLPKNFAVSDRVKAWAKEKGLSKLDEHLENFKLKAESKNYQYANWDTAFMGAIRDDWAKLNNQSDKFDPRDFPAGEA